MDKLTAEIDDITRVELVLLGALVSAFTLAATSIASYQLDQMLIQVMSPV